MKVRADFHSVEFSDWMGNLLFTCEHVALNLNRILHVSNISLCQIQSTRRVLLSVSQPLRVSLEKQPKTTFRPVSIILSDCLSNEKIVNSCEALH